MVDGDRGDRRTVGVAELGRATSATRRRDRSASTQKVAKSVEVVAALGGLEGGECGIVADAGDLVPDPFEGGHLRGRDLVAVDRGRRR